MKNVFLSLLVNSALILVLIVWSIFAMLKAMRHKKAEFVPGQL